SIMPIEEAVKQHKLKDGNINEAWKSFEFYSKLGDTTAKYYKGYYLSNNLMCLSGNKEDRFKQAANLFKEAADEGDVMKAQIQYASYLSKGNPHAIFNVGNMYYKGIGVNKNVRKGTTLIKSAAYEGYVPAIKFCKENKIPL
ncbi:19304_t:CDS:2, partial [Racocetra persica]